MPIETGQSTLYGSTTTEGGFIAAEKRFAQGRSFRAAGTVANAADALNTSSYKLISLPSVAVLKETTEFKISAWGFAQAVVGIASDTDALFDVLSSAGNQNPVTLFGTDHNKELWDLLGLSEDPGGEIELIATAEADATGAGSMAFVVDWCID